MHHVVWPGVYVDTSTLTSLTKSMIYGVKTYSNLLILMIVYCGQEMHAVNAQDKACDGPIMG